MLKICALALLSFSLMGWAQAPIDLNQATEIQLDSLHGVGPSMTRSLMREREKSAFLSWSDVMRRVKGMGAAKAAQLSSQGLRVQGLAFGQPEEQTAP